jgi:hypothetical protein
MLSEDGPSDEGKKSVLGIQQLGPDQAAGKSHGLKRRSFSFKTPQSDNMSPQLPFKNIHTLALVVDKAGSPFLLQEIVLDEVRDDELLVEIKYTGLCHTVSSMSLHKYIDLVQ